MAILDYRVEQHKRVKKFIRKHTDLNDRWPEIESVLAGSPRGHQGDDTIVHLKANLLCNYRWREGSYRLLFEVDDETKTVLIFDADSRGQVYRGR
ncbi:MAG: hypothetical protein A2W34_04255 [Chloroflexi bacterium RBG_16_64_32]|nr:MAG: hypothetical protein A2W34_04255 [Chloroflexi bacterium RBG_16_64_32]